jgi:hypothetical protein
MHTDANFGAGTGPWGCRSIGKPFLGGVVEMRVPLGRARLRVPLRHATESIGSRTAALEGQRGIPVVALKERRGQDAIGCL